MENDDKNRELMENAHGHKAPLRADSDRGVKVVVNAHGHKAPLTAGKEPTAQTQTQQAPYSNKLPAGVRLPYATEPPEQPMTRLQRLVVENLELKEQLAIERDHVDKCRAWAQELESYFTKGLEAIRMLKEELQDSDAMEPAEVG